MAQTKAYPSGPVPITLTATVPRFRFVGFDGAVIATGKDYYGVNQDLEGISGDNVTIYTGGVVAVETSGAITKGDAVKLATGGTIVTHGGSGDIIGYAVEDGADGDIIQVIIGRS